MSKKPSLEGKWILLFFERMSGVEVPAALLDISKGSNGKLKPIVKGYGKMLTNPRLRRADATDKTLHMAHRDDRRHDGAQSPADPRYKTARHPDRSAERAGSRQPSSSRWTPLP